MRQAKVNIIFHQYYIVKTQIVLYGLYGTTFLYQNFKSAHALHTETAEVNNKIIQNFKYSKEDSLLSDTNIRCGI